MRSVCSSLKSEGSAFGWSRRVCVLRSLALCYVRVHARIAGYEPGFGRTLSRGDVEKAQETFPLFVWCRLRAGPEVKPVSTISRINSYL